MATETHIAGLQLDVQGRYMLQRCGWCGAVMLAYDLERTASPVNADGSPPAPPGLFEVGRLVRHSYDGVVATWGTTALSRTSMAVLDETDTLPEDACALNLPFDVVTDAR